MNRLLLLMLLTLPVLAGDLMLKTGFAAIHMEMLFNNSTDPISTQLQADLSLDRDVTTLKGEAYLVLKTLSSDDEKRDEEMYETLETEKYPLATYTLDHVTMVGDSDYTLHGELTLHGVKKEVIFTGNIEEKPDTITIDARSLILMSDFNIEPPCMLFTFICARNELDLSFKAVFVK